MKSKLKTTIFFRHAMLSGAGLLMALSQPAFGQTDQTDRLQLEEIIVTAQKVEENLQEIPLSVTALTGATIDRLHVNDLKDITGTVPNVQIQVNAGLTNAASFVIRGIGIVANPSPYVGSEVGTVVDGVVQTVNELGLVDRFDVERIEILRGPQGTLFGANTTGGVVNIITRQPTGEYGAYGEVGVRNFSGYSGALAVNFPIAEDVLAGKIAFAHRQREGFYTNLYNGEDIGHLDTTAVRGYLLFTPSDKVDVTLKAEAQQIRNGTDVLLNISYPGLIFYRPDTPFDFKLYSDVPDQHNSDTWAVTLTANWESSFGDVTSITNYSDWKTRGYQDIDGIDLYGFAQIGNTRGWQFSQELRDVIQVSDSLQLLFGGFVGKWHYDSDNSGWLAFVDPGLINETLAEQTSKNFSLFAQMYLDLTDRLRLQLGGRMSHEKVEMTRSDVFYIQPAGTDPFKGFGNLVGAIALPVDPANPETSGSESWTNYGGKVGLDYKVAENSIAYGNYARGFKSGGFNGRISRAEDIGPYDPEYVDAFEVGIKSEMWDNRLRLNLAAFLNKWDDMQVDNVFYAGDPPVGHSAIVNAAKATTQGFEIEGQVILSDGLQINATLGYLDTKYDKFRTGSGPACPPQPEPQPVPCSNDYTGRDLPYSPKWNGSVTVDYAFPLAKGNAEAILQYTYNGNRWGNFTQRVSERITSNELVNANLSWSPADGKWTIAVWARNLFDKKYISLALDAPPVFTEGLLGAPREYGIDVRFDF